ncbi:MAG TPA: helix-turn-helix domain-containing protein [Mycobacterium sp.]|nr:helix-turn-helix domain-containing protein [Mycobacterium sp.]
MSSDAEQSTRRRILDATRVVLTRSGMRNLQLSEVAAEAGVSRPTLYRHFGTREGLLDEFAAYEQDRFDAGIATAVAGLRGDDRLDAVLGFIVEFQNFHTASAVVDIEPEHVLNQMRKVLPIIRDRIRRELRGPNADIAASAVVRVAVCHYLVHGGTPEQFLAELRLTAGLDPRRRRLVRTAAG